MSDNSINMEWNNFSVPSRFRDLGLVVGNSIFWVSRRGLADCSPVFNAMLYGGFKESNQEIITLPGKEPDEILESLRCVFPCNQIGEKKPIDGENLELLLSFGDEYQITDLLDRCLEFIKTKIEETTTKKIVQLSDKELEEILELLRCLFPSSQSGQKKPIDGENVEMLIRLGDEFQITDLLDRCWQFVMMKMQESSIEIIEFLGLAARYKIREIVRVGLRRLSEFNPEQLWNHRAFLTSPKNIRDSVLIVQRLRKSLPQNSRFDLIGYYCVICGSSRCGDDSNGGMWLVCYNCERKFKCIEVMIPIFDNGK